eukprot:15476108-Alexandrium_andersonii.AAC.1
MVFAPPWWSRFLPVERVLGGRDACVGASAWRGPCFAPWRCTERFERSWLVATFCSIRVVYN